MRRDNLQFFLLLVIAILICCGLFSIFRSRRGITTNATEELTTKGLTIVSMLLRIPGKMDFDSYMKSLEQVCRLEDDLVIYVEPDLVEHVKNLRLSNPCKTLVRAYSIEETWAWTERKSLHLDEQLKRAPNYKLFWQPRIAKKPELERSAPKFFAVYLEKARLLDTVAQENPFHSNYFAWLDIGSFRHPPEYPKQGDSLSLGVRKTLNEKVKDDRIIFLKMKEFTEDEVKTKERFLTYRGSLVHLGGACVVGSARVIHRWWKEFRAEALARTKEGFFAGDDQFINAHICLREEGLCAYIHPREKSIKWFDMPQALMGRYNPHISIQ